MINPFETIDARLSNIENLLLDLKHTSQNLNLQPEDEMPITIEKAAEIVNLSVDTIYGLIHRKKFPSNKPPGTKRHQFFKSELVDWIKSGRKKTSFEIKVERDNYLSAHKKKNK